MAQVRDPGYADPRRTDGWTIGHTHLHLIPRYDSDGDLDAPTANHETAKEV